MEAKFYKHFFKTHTVRVMGQHTRPAALGAKPERKIETKVINRGLLETSCISGHICDQKTHRSDRATKKRRWHGIRTQTCTQSLYKIRLGQPREKLTRKAGTLVAPHSTTHRHDMMPHMRRPPFLREARMTMSFAERKTRLTLFVSVAHVMWE